MPTSFRNEKKNRRLYRLRNVVNNVYRLIIRETEIIVQRAMKYFFFMNLSTILWHCRKAGIKFLKFKVF